MLGLAVAYAVGTAFGYAVAFNKGRRRGLELTLDTLIALGYVQTGVNARGETVIYKYWEENLQDKKNK
jgi:hypothetical protein